MSVHHHHHTSHLLPPQTTMHASPNTPPLPLSDGQSIPSAFPFRLTDGQSTNAIYTWTLRPQSCLQYNTPFLSSFLFYSLSFIAYLFLSSYKYLALVLLERHAIQELIPPLFCVWFLLFSHSLPAGGWVINNCQSASSSSSILLSPFLSNSQHGLTVSATKWLPQWSSGLFQACCFTPLCFLFRSHILPLVALSNLVHVHQILSNGTPKAFILCHLKNTTQILPHRHDLQQHAQSQSILQAGTQCPCRPISKAPLLRVLSATTTKVFPWYQWVPSARVICLNALTHCLSFFWSWYCANLTLLSRVLSRVSQSMTWIFSSFPLGRPFPGLLLSMEICQILVWCSQKYLLGHTVMSSFSGLLPSLVLPQLG